MAASRGQLELRPALLGGPAEVVSEYVWARNRSPWRSFHGLGREEQSA